VNKSVVAPDERFPLITDILRGSDYALAIFPPEYVTDLQLFFKSDKPYLTCIATDKPRPAKPEEIVRQLYLRLLIDHYGYSKTRITLERAVTMGAGVHEKRADIVICERDTPDTEYIIIEVKKASRRDGLEQLKSYCNATGSPLLLGALEIGCAEPFGEPFINEAHP